MYGLVDEEVEGIIAYFMSQDLANSAAQKLNKVNWMEGKQEGEEERYWITPRLDQNQTAQLLQSVAAHLNTVQF